MIIWIDLLNEALFSGKIHLFEDLKVEIIIIKLIKKTIQETSIIHRKNLSCNSNLAIYDYFTPLIKNTNWFAFLGL